MLIEMFLIGRWSLLQQMVPFSHLTAQVSHFCLAYNHHELWLYISRATGTTLKNSICCIYCDDFPLPHLGQEQGVTPSSSSIGALLCGCGPHRQSGGMSLKFVITVLSWMVRMHLSTCRNVMLSFNDAGNLALLREYSRTWKPRMRSPT